jgi:hypothetical protein
MLGLVSPQVGQVNSSQRWHDSYAFKHCCAQATRRSNRQPKETTDERFRRSMPIRWAWLDLNQRPHPYQAHSRDAFKLVERETTSSSME